jgi:hypothetical protein
MRKTAGAAGQPLRTFEGVSMPGLRSGSLDGVVSDGLADSIAKALACLRSKAANGPREPQHVVVTGGKCIPRLCNCERGTYPRFTGVFRSEGLAEGRDLECHKQSIPTPSKKSIKK